MAPDAVTPPDRERIWTVPNVLSGLRLVGVVPLAWLGWRGERTAFVVLLLALLLSDWLDGKLAVALDQRTELGPRLDSAADILMYTAVALSFWWLEPELIMAQAGWVGAAMGTWIVSALVSARRFGRLPSYHTRAAKAGWLVAGSVALYTLWSGDGRPVPWALAWVVLTNVEAVAIGLLLPEWRVDVPTFVHAVRLRRVSDSRDEGRAGTTEEGGAGQAETVDDEGSA